MNDPSSDDAMNDPSSEESAAMDDSSLSFGEAFSWRRFHEKGRAPNLVGGLALQVVAVLLGGSLFRLASVSPIESLGTVLLIVGAFVTSAVSLVGFFLLSLPSVFDPGVALVGGALLYVGVGAVAWAGVLRSVVPIGFVLLWPFALVAFHGCFLDSSLWPCAAR